MRIKLKTLLILFLLLSSGVFAQDTITLLNGKTLIVKSTELSGFSLNYRTLKPKSKLKRIDVDNVFSIRHPDGTEFIVYQPDTLDEEDYTISEMRMYIKGEQDALKYYRNHLNKVGAFVFGMGSAYFSFYGIVGPAIYASLIGSAVPKIDSTKVSDPALLQINEYKTGYERKARDRKTVNSILYGLAGFAAGIATYTIIKNN
jgi:hypothetical protein